MLITEPKQFGAVGFVQIPGSGRAFYRATHQDMHFIGEAEWQAEDDES